jgi:hypothetical protein
MLSNRSAALAVAVSFTVGLVASLALRPNGHSEVSIAQIGEATPTRLHWRVPTTSSSNLPVLGDNTKYISATAAQISARCLGCRSGRQSSSRLQLAWLRPGENSRKRTDRGRTVRYGTLGVQRLVVRCRGP